MSRARVNSMLGLAVAIFAISFVLQKTFQVQEPGANALIWWIVAAGKMAGMLGIVVFGAWSLKLKFISGERANG